MSPPRSNIRQSATKLPREEEEEEEEEKGSTEEATEEAAIVGQNEDVNVSADLFIGVLLGSAFLW